MIDLAVNIAIYSLFLIAGAVFGAYTSDGAAVRRGWIKWGGRRYAVEPPSTTIPAGLRQPNEPVADNLGGRVRTLMDRGIFDAQIERAIQRNNERRG